jgi:hypothetical protein
MRLIEKLATGQGIMLYEDLQKKIPYNIDITDFNTLTHRAFNDKYQDSKTTVLAELQLPIWFLVRPSNKRGKKGGWKIAAPNGETRVIMLEDILCQAKIGHSNHNFTRWILLNSNFDAQYNYIPPKKLHGINCKVPEQITQDPFTFQDPLSKEWFQFQTQRGNFVIQMLPYGANINKRGIVNFKDRKFVMNMGHLNQYNAKFYKSKYGIGYIVESKETPKYSISKRLNAITYEIHKDWPKSISNEDGKQIFYIPLSYFEPYGIPDGRFTPKTLHILNWCATGCDTAIYTNL